MVDHGIRPTTYNLHVTERGTKFTETIIVDEDKDLEYFHVPAHNQVTEAADYLYDFKNASIYSLLTLSLRLWWLMGPCFLHEGKIEMESMC